MTHDEIKKAYKKAKKAYEKRTGDKMVWVMNRRQQDLGTATICTGVAIDYMAKLRQAELRLARVDQDWQAQLDDYTKRAQAEALKNRHTPGWYFGRNDTFWEDVVADTAGLEERRKEELARREEAVRTYEDLLQKDGDYRTCLNTKTAEAQAIIDSPEVQDFLRKIGGSAEVELKGPGLMGEYSEVYIRFHYHAE